MKGHIVYKPSLDLEFQIEEEGFSFLNKPNTQPRRNNDNDACGYRK